MYIIELFLKRWAEKNKFGRVISKKKGNTPSDYEKCDHTFMPIDSTGKIFACTKCGEILKK